MKYFFTIAKAIYTMFIILTMGMLVLAIGISARVSIPFERYIGYIYLVVLLITLVTIIINIVIGYFF